MDKKTNASFLNLALEKQSYDLSVLNRDFEFSINTTNAEAPPPGFSRFNMPTIPPRESNLPYKKEDAANPYKHYLDHANYTAFVKSLLAFVFPLVDEKLTPIELHAIEKSVASEPETFYCALTHVLAKELASQKLIPFSSGDPNKKNVTTTHNTSHFDAQVRVTTQNGIDLLFILPTGDEPIIK
jgi:hypothetical protein